MASISYSGGDVTKMYRIAKITIKPKKKGIITIENGEKHVVEIVTDSKGSKTYICDYWISEGVPFSVPESQVAAVVSYV
jgi:hypothetical protein